MRLAYGPRLRPSLAALVYGCGSSEAAFDIPTYSMAVTVLYRLEGEPSVAGIGNPFPDVEDGQWYTDAILWAYSKGIVIGYTGGPDAGKFGPDDTVTREQFATILYRYSQYKELDTSASADISGYPDADDVSDWAMAAMRWANAEGIITGRDGKVLAPTDGTTRAEMATILKRFIEGA